MSSNETVILQQLVFFVVAIGAALISRKILQFSIDKYFQQLYKSAQSRGRSINKKRLNTLARAFRSIAAITVWVIFAFVVLGHFNVNMAALLTGAGAVGIFFSITSRDIIMDLYVGFMALIEDQYRVGDEIEISKEHAGVVEEITLRTVKLRDDDGCVHIIPHSMARSVINKTYDYSIVNIEMSIGYNADSEKIKTIVDTVGKELDADERWGRIFVEPITFYSMLSFDKDELTFKAQGKVKPGKQTAAESEFKLRVTDAFEHAGISTSVVTSPEETAPAKKKTKK